MAHADKSIALLLETYGAEAYGVWWLILEDIAAPMEAGKMFPISSHSVVKWSQICHCSVRRFRSIVKILVDEELIQLSASSGERVTIAVPSLEAYGGSDRPPSHIWEQLRGEVFQRDNWTCVYCGAHGVKLECDHVEPVSRGGASVLENLATACFACNRSKRDKTVGEWLQ